MARRSSKAGDGKPWIHEARWRAQTQTSFIDRLPEPYRTAAREMPGDEWQFVYLALLRRGSRHSQGTPAERKRFKTALDRLLSHLFPRPGRRGRPSLDVSDPFLRQRLRELYDQRRRTIAQSKKPKLRGEDLPAEQALREISKETGVGIGLLKKALFPKPPRPAQMLTLQTLQELRKLPRQS